MIINQQELRREFRHVLASRFALAGLRDAGRLRQKGKQFKFCIIVLKKETYVLR